MLMGRSGIEELGIINQLSDKCERDQRIGLEGENSHYDQLEQREIQERAATRSGNMRRTIIQVRLEPHGVS